MNPNQSQSMKQPQMPQQPFTASHNHIYETLRQNLMKLHQQGVPGLDEVLHALNKAHIGQMKNMQQSQGMPQGQPQGMPIGQAAGQGLGGMAQGGQMGQMPPQMPQGGQ